MMLRHALQTVTDRKAVSSAPSSHCCARPPSSPPAERSWRRDSGTIGTERHAATPILVSADQNVHETTVKEKQDGRTKTKHKAKPVAERAWLPAATVDTVRAVPGVERAVPELTFPAAPWPRPRQAAALVRGSARARRCRRRCPGPRRVQVGVTGRPAAFQAWKPPVRSVARCRPSAWSEAAARLDA